MSNSSKTIKLLENGEFTSRDVSASNVGELRNELDISSDSSVNVGGTIRQNDYDLSDGDFVAYSSNNKVGGNQ